MVDAKQYFKAVADVHSTNSAIESAQGYITSQQASVIRSGYNSTQDFLAVWTPFRTALVALHTACGVLPDAADVRRRPGSVEDAVSFCAEKLNAYVASAKHTMDQNSAIIGQHGLLGIYEQEMAQKATHAQLAQFETAQGQIIAAIEAEMRRLAAQQNLAAANQAHLAQENGVLRAMVEQCQRIVAGLVDDSASTAPSETDFRDLANTWAENACKVGHLLGQSHYL